MRSSIILILMVMMGVVYGEEAAHGGGGKKKGKVDTEKYLKEEKRGVEMKATPIVGERVPDDSKLLSIKDFSKNGHLEGEGEDGEVLIKRARFAKKEGQVEKAEELLQKALKMELSEERKKEVLLKLGQIYDDEGVLSKMVMVYEKYFKEYPKTEQGPQILIRLGRAYRDMGSYQLALDRFYGVMDLSLGIKDEEMAMYRYLTKKAQMEIADTYFLKGEYDNAMKLCERLLLGDLDFKEKEYIEFKLIYCSFNLKKYEKVEKEVEEFLKNYPRNRFLPEVYYMMASVYQQTNRLRESLEELMKLIGYDESRESKEERERWVGWKKKTANLLANTFYEMRDWKNALGVYQVMVKLNVEAEWQLPLLYQIGNCYLNLGVYGKARETFELVVNGKLWEKQKYVITEQMKSLQGSAKWHLRHLEWKERSVKDLMGVVEDGGKKGDAS